MVPGQAYWGLKDEVSPSFTKEESIVNNTLLRSLVPSEMLRQTRPPIPLDPFPPRFGYRKMEPTIYEVIDVPRNRVDARDDYSGAYGRFQGSSRPSLGHV